MRHFQFFQETHHCDSLVQHSRDRCHNLIISMMSGAWEKKKTVLIWWFRSHLHVLYRNHMGALRLKIFGLKGRLGFREF